MTDSSRLSYTANDGGIRVIVPARRTRLFFFVTPIFLSFSIVAVVSFFYALQKPDSTVIGLAIFSVFVLFFLYVGLTSLLALLWTLFGKDSIIVDKKGIRIDRVLFLNFSSSYFERDKILNVYVNSRDYEVNKISKGRNDFLSIFGVGTIHFFYKDRLQHIAGGMTDEEAKKFLIKINYSKSG